MDRVLFAVALLSVATAAALGQNRGLGLTGLPEHNIFLTGEVNVPIIVKPRLRYVGANTYIHTKNF